MDIGQIEITFNEVRKFLPMLRELYSDWSKFKAQNPAEAQKLESAVAAEIFAPLHAADASPEQVAAAEKVAADAKAAHDAAAPAQHVEMTPELLAEINKPLVKAVDEIADVGVVKAKADTDAKLAAELAADKAEAAKKAAVA